MGNRPSPTPPLRIDNEKIITQDRFYEQIEFKYEQIAFEKSFYAAINWFCFIGIIVLISIFLYII